MSTPGGSPLLHTLPSPLPPPPPPPGPEPVGSLSWRLGFEWWVIPRTTAMDAVKAELAYALVAMVGGSRPRVSTGQVLGYLDRVFGIVGNVVQVRRSYPDDFLLSFPECGDTDRVLLAAIAPPLELGFTLTFRRWTRQARASFAPLLFKVLLSITNVPAQAWSVETAQMIMGTSCLIKEVAPSSLQGADLS
jgi:hypothetical protein